MLEELRKRAEERRKKMEDGSMSTARGFGETKVLEFLDDFWMMSDDF